MIRDYLITWRYPMQYGRDNEQIFVCAASSLQEATNYFRQKEGFNRKKIMRVEAFQQKKRY